MKSNKEHIGWEDIDEKSKKNNFKLPERYFDDLKESLEMKIKSNSQNDFSELDKQNNFKVPINYYSQLKDSLPDKLIEDKVKPNKTNLKILYTSIIAIAAIFIGLIVFSPSSRKIGISEMKNSSVSVSVMEYQLSAMEELENFDPLVAILSESEDESDYDYLFKLEEKTETTVEDIQDLFIDEWEEDADFIY